MTMLLEFSEQVAFTIKAVNFLIFRTAINLITAAPQHFGHTLDVISERSFAGSIVSVPKSDCIVFGCRYDSIHIFVKMKGFPNKGSYPFGVAFKFHRVIVC